LQSVHVQNVEFKTKDGLVLLVPQKNSIFITSLRPFHNEVL